MRTDIKIKYRLEEHYKNEKSYLLHGIFDKLQYAKNKKAKLIESGIKKENLFILKVITQTTWEIVE